MKILPQRKFFLSGLILFLILVLLAGYSSAKPDGLERILRILALDKTSDVDHSVPFADYVISPGLPDILNRSLSALIGMAMIVILVFLIYKISTTRPKEDRIDHAT